jgi:hypothetical protein
MLTRRLLLLSLQMAGRTAKILSLFPSRLSLQEHKNFKAGSARIMLQSQLSGRGTPRQEIADRSSPLFKARELLCSILPTAAREEFLLQDAFYYRGKRASYRICRSSQTEIYWNGHLGGNACLQLTPARWHDQSYGCGCSR